LVRFFPTRLEYPGTFSVQNSLAHTSREVRNIVQDDKCLHTKYGFFARKCIGATSPYHAAVTRLISLSVCLFSFYFVLQHDSLMLDTKR